MIAQFEFTGANLDFSLEDGQTKISIVSDGFKLNIILSPQQRQQVIDILTRLQEEDE